MDLTKTRTLVDHLVDHLDSRERPGQQVVVYLDSLHPYRDDQTLEDLILSARSELREFDQLRSLRFATLLKSLRSGPDQGPADRT